MLGSAIVEGWRLVVDSTRDDDDGTVKMYHDAHHEDGRVQMIDWSPYKSISNTDFKRLVLLGFPTRQAVGSKGPLGPEDLDVLWAKRFGDRPVWEHSVGSPLVQELLDAPIRSLPTRAADAKSN